MQCVALLGWFWQRSVLAYNNPTVVRVSWHAVLCCAVLCCAGMTRDQMVVAKEESTEFGGYFICNGIERIIRMLILQVRDRAGCRVWGVLQRHAVAPASSLPSRSATTW